MTGKPPVSYPDIILSLFPDDAGVSSHALYMAYKKRQGIGWGFKEGITKLILTGKIYRNDPVKSGKKLRTIKIRTIWRKSNVE